MTEHKSNLPIHGTQPQRRKPYNPPRVSHELRLETQAAGSVGPSGGGFPDSEAPDIFPTPIPKRNRRRY